MNEPVIRTSRSIGWLRFIVWIMPTCASPFIILGALSLSIPFSLELGVIGEIAALIYLARFDARLACQQRQIPPGDPRAKIGIRTAIFVGVQLVLVPALWIAYVVVSIAIWGFPKIGC